MGVVVSGQGASSSRVIFDGWESFSGFHNPTNNEATMVLDQRDSTAQFNGGTSQGFFATVSGAPGATVQFESTIGRIVQTWPSQAAISGYNAQGQTQFNVPFWQRFSLALSIPLSMLPPLWRYRCDFTNRITIAGATEAALAIGGDNNPGLAGTLPFIGWSYRAAVNGGRWTPRSRLVTAGAITDGPDSGISTTGWHKLSLMFTPGLVPRCDWLIDNVVKHSLVGDAAIPSAIAGAFKIFPSKSLGAGAGTTMQSIESRFTIDEIG